MIHAVVTGADQPLGAAATQGLRASGAAVVALPTADTSRSAATNAIVTAATELGAIDVLVISGWSSPQLAPLPFEQLDDQGFHDIWEGAMQGTLWSLQAAIPYLRAAGGSAIAMLPTTGMTGGSHYAAAAATFEAQRILMKSAARQLAPEGIRVNIIAVGAEMVLADADAADVHYLAPSASSASSTSSTSAAGALEGQPTGDDLANTIRFLISPAARHLSGQTITIDGGRWLAP